MFGLRLRVGVPARVLKDKAVTRAKLSEAMNTMVEMVMVMIVMERSTGSTGRGEAL